MLPLLVSTLPPTFSRSLAEALSRKPPVVTTAPSRRPRCNNKCKSRPRPNANRKSRKLAAGRRRTKSAAVRRKSRCVFSRRSRSVPSARKANASSSMLTTRRWLASKIKLSSRDSSRPTL